MQNLGTCTWLSRKALASFGLVNLSTLSYSFSYQSLIIPKTVDTSGKLVSNLPMQVFLLLRRLHRDLSAILEAIRETPHDVTAVAQKASAILHGTSVEPNPLESEDNAGEPSHVGDLKTLGKEATPRECTHLGKNITDRFLVGYRSLPGCPWL